jgi:hydroxymethylglutaryl-CoA lyase
MSLQQLNHRKFTHSMRLPEQVRIVEVSPRDGLQNQPVKVATEIKTALIDRLSKCGFAAIETGSLVSPERVPQMADSEQVYQHIKHHPNTDYIMLVPNLRGMKQAIACQVQYIAVICTASEAFSLKNINCSIDASMQRIKSICNSAKENNITVRAYISCVLGCPYQGRVDLTQVCHLAASLYEYGCQEISLADTIGVGTPGQVHDLINAIAQQVPVENIAVHFHDSYGQALANILVALQTGVSIIDCSAGGLGGCPFAPGSSGNVASEDVVYMLNGLGIKSGIDIAALMQTSIFINDILHRQPASKVTLASICS